jgi:hypothetical protein
LYLPETVYVQVGSISGIVRDSSSGVRPGVVQAMACALIATRGSRPRMPAGATRRRDAVWHVQQSIPLSGLPPYAVTTTS